jgi:hypothetical protein
MLEMPPKSHDSDRFPIQIGNRRPKGVQQLREKHREESHAETLLVLASSPKR